MGSNIYVRDGTEGGKKGGKRRKEKQRVFEFCVYSILYVSTYNNFAILIKRILYHLSSVPSTVDCSAVFISLP